MNREALEQTVRVLEDVKKFHLAFHLASFVGANVKLGEGEVDNYKLGCSSTKAVDELFAAAMEKEQVILIPHNCGCTACATGYAGLDPWFQEQGFRTTPSGNLSFGLYKGWYALLAFYNLSTTEAEYLFMPEPYAKPDDPQLVIDRIRDVLRDGFPDLGRSNEEE